MDVTIPGLSGPIADPSLTDRLPPMVDCVMRFPRPLIDGLSGTDDSAATEAAIRSAVDAAMRSLPALGGLEQGQTVAVTAGSRGISNIVAILRAACEYLRRIGVVPVVVSAMGSHGGDTAEGQRELLRSLGITEESLGGVKVHCSTATVEVGRTPGGRPVRIDGFAATGADGILIVNRIKPHTAFRGPTESGLLKMIAVGLGHQSGAAGVHAAGPALMCETIRSMAAAALGKLPVLGGLAIIENGYEQTAKIAPLRPEQFLSDEEALLAEARAMLPRLPVMHADLLIIERIGKEISGTGMDTNVHGRWGSSDPGPAAGPSPEFARLVVLDLTPASHGNATGIGLADFSTERLIRTLDRRSTYMNCLTSTFIDRARLPLFLPDDRQAIAAAVMSLGAAVDPSALKVLQIKDTLHLETIRVSTTLVPDLAPPPGVTLATEPLETARPLRFAADGTLARLL